MSVIIFILKLLGILLLTVIGILLLLIILLLFCPVGYRAEGVSEEKIKLSGSFFWLFHIVSFRLCYDVEEGIDTCFKICGIQIGKKQKKDGEEMEADFGEMPEADGSSEEMPEDSELLSKEAVPQMEPVPLQEQKTSPKKKRGFHFFRKWRELQRKWKEFWQELHQKIQDVTQKAEEWKGQLMDRTNQMAVSYIWKELIYLLKHLRFRRIKAELDFSLKDPAATGQALGILAVLPVMYQYDIHVYPDFLAEQAYVKGYFKGRGHFRLLHLLLSGIRLLLKRECRILMKRVFK